MAGAMLLLLGSCLKEEERVIFDASQCTPPVLTEYSVTDGSVSVIYTPAVMNINQKIAYHALALVSLDGQQVSKNLTTTDKNGVLTVSSSNLVRALMALGCEDGSVHDIKLVIRASSLKTPEDDAPNSYIESVSGVEISGYEVVLPGGDPYARYTEKSEWGLVGSFNGWGGEPDVEMWTNGTLHVAKSVSLSKGTEVKFRKDSSWDVNFGYAEGVDSYELGVEFAVGQGGPNIVIAEDGVYDFILDPDGQTAKIIASVAPQEDPYAAYTEVSPWSVIGSFNSWGGDVEMVTNGTLHVCKNITFTAGTEFKFRKDGSWDVNFGYAEGVDSYELGVEFAVAGNGGNIKIAEDGAYDLFLDPENATAKIIKTQAVTIDPYAAYTEESPWSVIGSFNSWGGDYPMVSNGTLHVAKKISLEAGVEWKFRKDGKWDVNFGYAEGVDTYELGEEFAVGQDGGNIKVLETGVYDFILDPDNATAKVIKSVAVDGGEEPGPGPVEPEKPKGWNIIGLNGDWDNDVLATQDGDLWTAYITAESDTEFKWRKDGGWDENYGGVMVALGEPFAAVAGGDNIKIGAGFWKVVLDTANLTITVSNGNVWALIGVNGDWDNDIDMVETDGKWVSPATKMEGEFKIRKNHGWDENFGGTLVAIGEPFAAVAGGDNIKVAGGTYVVTFDPEAATITVDELGWGLVGTINSWSAPDIMMKEEGRFLVARNVFLGAEDEFKLRYNQDWGVNRGSSRSIIGLPLKAVQDGGNIKVGVEGEYDIYYRPDCDVIIVNMAGNELRYWGVVGTINSWSAPDKILYVNDNMDLESDELELSATDEIKIRVNEDWAENRGGAFSALGEPIAVAHDGPNIALGREAKVKLVYNAVAETITIEGQFTGDAPSFPDYIYAIGGDTGWSSCYPLYGKNGQYKGFGYLSDPFKFKPNQDNWEGDWECVGEGQIGQGSDNCPAPEAGYYMIEVDLNEMTYQLTAISTIGIIGPAQAGGWDADTDLAYNAASGAWEGTVTFTAGEMKFRANDNWDINWGGSLDALVQNGGNIAVAAGTYDVQLFAWCDGKAYATLTAAAAEPSYAIDGNFSEWASVKAIEGQGAVKVLKVGSTDDMMYFYMEMDKSALNFNNLAYADYMHLCVDNGDAEGEKSSGNWNGAQYDKYYQFWLMHDGNPKMYNWSFSSFDRKAAIDGDVVKYEWCFERSANAAFAGKSMLVGVYVTDQSVDTSSGSEVWSENPETIGWAPAKDSSMATVTLK